MNPLQKSVVTALCIGLSLAVSPVGQTLGAETKAADKKEPAATQEAVKTVAPAEQKATETAKTSPSDTVAKVGNTVITRAEMDRAATILLKQNKPQQPLTAEQTKQVNDYVLEQLIAAELLYQAGAKLEVKDLDKKIDERVTEGKSRFQTPEQFQDALKEQGIDEKILREYTRKEIIVNNYIEQEVASKVTVSDDDAKKFYNDNLDKYFRKPEQVKASHILIGVDAKADAETKQKAKEKAEALLKEVKEGKKEFAEIAKTSSSCPSSAQGGDLGFFGKGQMVKPFEDAAFALNPGEVSGIVETQFGYHIIKLTEKNKSETTTFEEAKQQIMEYLKGQQVNTRVNSFINELRAKTKVDKMV